jgi:hypothetical protein
LILFSLGVARLTLRTFWDATGPALILFTLVHYLVAMSDDAARFRKQAEECREQAAKAISPLESVRDHALF